MIQLHHSACSAFVLTIDNSDFVSVVEPRLLIHMESLVGVRRLALNRSKAIVA